MMLRIKEQRFSRKLLMAGVSACLLGVGSAAEALAVVDFNDFSLGATLGQDGGTGFDPDSTWGGSGVINVIAGDLASSNYALTQSGTAQSVQGAFTAVRHTNRDLNEALSGRVWFSFLANLPTSGSRAGLAFNTTSTNGTDFNHSIFLLGDSTLRINPGLEAGNGVDGTISATVGETALIVGYFDTDENTIAAWFDPDLINQPNIYANSPTVEADILDGTELAEITRLGVMSWGANNIGGIVDHVRLGNDFTDVTGAVIPEPGSLALLGLGAIAVMSRRRRS